ncbi:MAG TPA: DUF1877 family protein [Verrucomicrobiae bacterium]|nr:DUF1877 family protein [Verrucomicrobiae bacterium]
MDRTRNLRETQNREQFRYNLAGTATRAQMGMYAKLRHVPVTELTAAKKDPANFYRNLYSIQGTVDRRIMLQGLAGQIGEAIKGSPLAKEFTDMPEVRRVSNATRQGKSADPADQKAAVQKMLELLPKMSFRPNLSQLLPRAPKVPEGLELEKSWHCLHFLFSGKVWDTGSAPIEKAILGGTEIVDVEGIMGYGPARYLEESEVEKIAAALERFPIEERARAFDSRAAADAKIYCPDCSAEELVHYFSLLKNYYHEATLKEHAMLIWLE